MWEFRHAETTTALPQQVWARYANPAAWPQWDHEISHVSVQGAMAVGSRGRLKPVKGPATSFVFTEITPGASFTNVTQLPLARVTVDHRIEAIDTGTRFIHTVTITGPLSPLFGRIIGKNIAAGLPSAMRALAELAETSAAPTSTNQ